MFACLPCEEMCVLPLDSCLSHRLPQHDVVDQAWCSLRQSAEAAAKQEPVLRARLEDYVLQRSSFADGLAKLLADKLGDQRSPSSTLFDEFSELLEQDRTIARSVAADLQAIVERDPAVDQMLHPFLNFKGFHALSAYRIANSLWTVDRRALAYHLQSRASERFGVDIHPAARIGHGVLIDHATGVVIGETAVVGNDVTILHGVTLGSTGKERGDRHPKIGDGVFIGAASQLLGNIRIGDGSTIGAGSVVLSSVESDSTVAGVPARVVGRTPRATIPLARRTDFSPLRGALTTD